jgi:hypothetical protein
MADPDAPEGSHAMVAGVRFYQVIETVVPVRNEFDNVRGSHIGRISPVYLETINKAFDLYEEVAAEMDFLPLDIKIDNLGFIGDRLVMFDADPTWMIFKEQFDSAMEKSIVRFRTRTDPDPDRDRDLIINAKPRFLQYLFAAITLMMANWENSNTEYLLRREGVDILLRQKIAAFTNQLFYRILLLELLKYSAFETIIRHYCFSNFENRNSHMVNIGFNARILTESTIFQLWKRHINKESKKTDFNPEMMYLKYLTETNIRALLPPLAPQLQPTVPVATPQVAQTNDTVASVMPPPPVTQTTDEVINHVPQPPQPPPVAVSSVMPTGNDAPEADKRREAKRAPISGNAVGTALFEPRPQNSTKKKRPKLPFSEPEEVPAKKQGTDTNPFSAFDLPTN